VYNSHMEEFLDILNPVGDKTGESKSYDQVHRDGLMHRTVHVWLMNSKKQLLLQKRSKQKRAYPSLWDISSAGHVSSGQTSIEAAVRETKEELGLTISSQNFQFLFTVEEHVILNNGTYINNEFQDVYLVNLDVDILSLRIQQDEVDEVRWVDVGKFEEWILGQGETLVPHEEEHRKLLEHLNRS